MSDELKPCPFCGAPAKIYGPNRNNGALYVAWCTNTSSCDAGATGYGDTPEEATEQWNTRPVEDALRAENVILLNALRVERANTAAAIQGMSERFAVLDDATETLRAKWDAIPWDALLVAWKRAQGPPKQTLADASVLIDMAVLGRDIINMRKDDDRWMFCKDGLGTWLAANAPKEANK